MKLEVVIPHAKPFENVFEGPRYERLKRNLLSIMIRQKDILFRDSVDPEGNPWKPLSPLAEEVKVSKNKRSAGQIKDLQETNDQSFSAHKILVGTGMLKNSLTSSVAPYAIRSTGADTVALGTNVPYAKIHNFGGVIKPKIARALKIPTPGGFIFRGKVTIPARPYIGIGDNDEAAIQEKIGRYVGAGGKG